MRRGTTPEYTLNVGMDLSGWTCYVAVRRREALVSIEGNRLDITGGETSTIRFSLTQRETLRLRPGRAEVQVRAIKDGVAVATDIATIEIGEILRDGEIND